MNKGKRLKYYCEARKEMIIIANKITCSEDLPKEVESLYTSLYETYRNFFDRISWNEKICKRGIKDE